MSSPTGHGFLDRITGSRVLVTGGGGLIGRAVVALLAEQGTHVTVYDVNRPASDAAAIEDGAETLVAGSVIDPGAVQT